MITAVCSIIEVWHHVFFILSKLQLLCTIVKEYVINTNDKSPGGAPGMT